MMKCLFASWGMLLGLGACAAQSKTAPPDPCHVLTHLEDYKNQKVSLRGEYFIRGDGLYLRINNCQSQLRRNGYEWPPALLLSVSGREANDLGLSVDSIEAALLDAGAKIAEKIGPSGKDDWSAFKITLTCTGILHTHDDLNLHVVQQGDNVLSDGFGPSGWAPGELFLQSVSDIEVEKRREAGAVNPTDGTRK